MAIRASVAGKKVNKVQISPVLPLSLRRYPLMPASDMAGNAKQSAENQDCMPTMSHAPLPLGDQGPASDTLILGIESSCDDTAMAIWDGCKIRANLCAGQKIHRQYGGVVPELASRDHEKHIVPLLHAVLGESGIVPSQIQAIGFTRGPGLLGSLLVGASFAKALAWSWKLPLLGVHHMKAHVLAHFIEPPFPPFPFLCLTVSGGHTQLIRVVSPLDMEVLGSTLDDAAGEAFDKCAKLLGLDYPGGPELDRLAKAGNPERFSFARPEVPDLNFSFSGLKTSVLYFLRDLGDNKESFVRENMGDLCASIQNSIVRTLLAKVKRASAQTGILHIALAGGVSANSGLRQALQDMATVEGWSVYLPALEYCTDNAAMVARTAAFMHQHGVRHSQSISVEARLPW